MKILSWVLGVVMAVAIVFFGLQVIASETGEVVVLYSGSGETAEQTRLWVVEHDGHLWLRSGGGAASGWYRRLAAEPRVELERDGVRRAYLATPEPAMTGRINELIAEKYGWRDDLISALAGSRENGIAVKLTEVE